MSNASYITISSGLRCLQIRSYIQWPCWDWKYISSRHGLLHVYIHILSVCFSEKANNKFAAFLRATGNLSTERTHHYWNKLKGLLQKSRLTNFTNVTFSNLLSSAILMFICSRHKYLLHWKVLRIWVTSLIIAGSGSDESILFGTLVTITLNHT
jgi:hypothetical protein